MRQMKVAGFALAIAALALGTASCVGSPDAAADEDVAVTTQALGGFTQLVDVGNEQPLDIGATFTVYRNQAFVESCGVADVVLTQTGAHVPVPALPGCANITAASSQDGGVYVADQRGGKIYELRSTTSGGNTVYSWSPYIDTGNVMVKRVIRRSPGVYWLGSNNVLHYFDTFVGHELFNRPFAGDLLAVSNGVFGSFPVSGGRFELRKLEWPGGSHPDLVLASSATNLGVAWVTLDSTNVYWVEPATATTSNYLMSVPQAGGATTIVKASMAVKYSAPQSNGSTLYWLEINVSDGATQLRRKNLSNGVQMGVNFPFTWNNDVPVGNLIKVLPDGIYFTPYAPVHWALERGSL